VKRSAGFILHRFERFLGGGATGIVVYSGLFGLGHMYQGWDASLTVAVLGALWGSIYLIAAASLRRWSATRASTSRSW
jgi:hypothetical protein